MKKDLENGVNSVIIEDTQRKVSGKISTNVENSDTANVMDETENPKKKAVFDAISELFGFSVFNAEELAVKLANDLATGKISYAEFQKAISSARKETNEDNRLLDNIPFEEVCSTIEKSNLINDFALFVGTTDLQSLKPLLINNDNKVILYHSSQSEDGEKYASMKVTKKGLHKPYSDIIYYSLVDYSASNIIRAFRCFGYYRQSLKRVNRQLANEVRQSNNMGLLVSAMHKDLGFMPIDFAHIVCSALGIGLDEFISSLQG